MKRYAFSIAEFVISIMFMFIMMGMVVSIPLKKAKMTKHNLKQDGVKICTCSNPEHVENGCEFEFDTTGRFEFYTIQILGGGAAGGVQKGGAAGEGKIIHYPTLNGKYLVKLGKGGEFSSDPNVENLNIHGGSTVLYKILDNGDLELVEFARGGASGKVETIDVAALVDSTEVDEMQKGEKPSFGSASDAICGSGGNVGESGQTGEVIIKW